MTFTRRDTTKLFIAAAAGIAVPITGLAGAGQDWSSRLQADLEAHLVSGGTGRLMPVSFAADQRGSRIVMSAVVRLDWPPGQRIRRFEVSSADAEAAYLQLLTLTVTSFAKAWPEGVRAIGAPSAQLS